MTGNQSTVENAKEKLDRWLKDGITTPGGKLPSERELGELLGIKRMTLRQALLNLEAESKIFRKDRKGWFVTQPRFNYSPELSASFQRAAIEQGREPSWGFTEKSRTSDIPETLAPLIAVTPSTELYRITGWGALEGHKVFYHETYINPEVAPGFIEQLENHSGGGGGGGGEGGGGRGRARGNRGRGGRARAETRRRGCVTAKARGHQRIRPRVKRQLRSLPPQPVPHQKSVQGPLAMGMREAYGRGRSGRRGERRGGGRGAGGRRAGGGGGGRGGGGRERAAAPAWGEIAGREGPEDGAGTHRRRGASRRGDRGGGRGSAGGGGGGRRGAGPRGRRPIAGRAAGAGGESEGRPRGGTGAAAAGKPPKGKERTQSGGRKAEGQRTEATRGDAGSNVAGKKAGGEGEAPGRRDGRRAGNGRAAGHEKQQQYRERRKKGGGGGGSGLVPVASLPGAKDALRRGRRAGRRGAPAGGGRKRGGGGGGGAPGRRGGGARGGDAKALRPRGRPDGWWVAWRRSASFSVGSRAGGAGARAVGHVRRGERPPERRGAPKTPAAGGARHHAVSLRWAGAEGRLPRGDSRQNSVRRRLRLPGAARKGREREGGGRLRGRRASRAFPTGAGAGRLGDAADAGGQCFLRELTPPTAACSWFRLLLPSGSRKAVPCRAPAHGPAGVGGCFRPGPRVGFGGEGLERGRRRQLEIVPHCRCFGGGKKKRVMNATESSRRRVMFLGLVTGLFRASASWVL